jgi:Anti-sigma factor NepR
MIRDERPAKGRVSDDEPDPLDAALRQMGADILDEPVPERLRDLLRRARGESQGAPDPGSPASGSGKRRSEAGRE